MFLYKNQNRFIKLIAGLTVFTILMINPGCEEKPENKDTDAQAVSGKVTDAITESKKLPEMEISKLDLSSYRTEDKSVFNAPASQDIAKQSLLPVKKTNGKKWRIAFIEGGAFYRYGLILTALSEGLRYHGWISYEKLPDFRNKADTQKIWRDFLSSARVQSDYMEFVRDAFYSSKWDRQKRKSVAHTLISRLNNLKDIDLIIAMGTWASLDLANNAHSVPVVSMSVTDPVASGVVPSPFDSGLDHLHARVDPFVYRRQLAFFHETVKFKRLGVCYKDYKTGWTYATMDDVIAMAKEKNFEVVACKLKRFSQDEKEADEAQAGACMEKLAREVDAVYITPSSSFSHGNVNDFLEPLFRHKIPTFVQHDSEFVEYGALMGMESNFQQIGNYQAEIIAQILNGAKPRDLGQVFKETQKIAFNIKTAELIDFKYNDKFLSRVNKVYSTIKTREIR